MELIWNYGHSAVTLPGDVCRWVPTADEAALRVILALTDPAVAAAPDIVSALVGAARLSIPAVKNALEFWQKKGIFTLSAATQPAQNTPEQTISAVPAGKIDVSMPEYSSEEIGNVLEKRGELSDLVDVCNQLWGKMLNRHEIGKIVTLVDYYGINSDYLSETFSYAVQEDRKSVGFVEKLIVQMMDEGVTETDALRERLTNMHRIHTFEGEVRALFGLKSRALSAKEKKMVTAWTDEYGYEMDVVKRAYDVTVDAIGSPALPYANAVLDRWFRAGLKTLAEVENDVKTHSAQGNGAGSTYETDDAFAEALKRSYGAEYDKMGLNIGKGSAPQS